MKKKTILLTFIIIVLIQSYSYCEKPKIDAQSAILIDVESKRILLEYNPYLKLPMASTTKIMTALVALKEGELDDKVQIERDVVDIEGSSIYLQDGEILTLEDLLYGLMLRSGNDSAMAIANHIGKDLDEFINIMNTNAKKIGANNTNFVNPHGLHNDNHYTTAYDLALITGEAMEIGKFKEITSAKVWEANREKNNIFYNKNKTLTEYEGGDGVKTGYTTRSGRCLVTSATRDNTQLIAIVLNDRNWFEDCYKLMDYGFENYNTYVILEEEQFLKDISVINGEKDHVDAITKNSFLYPLKKEEVKKVKVSLSLPETIEAPIEKGDIIGNIIIYLDGKIIHKEDIVSNESINKLGFLKRFFKNIKNQ